MNPRVIFGGLAAVLLAANGLVAQKEWLLHRGDLLLLPLAPVDPRSLMQGDYMALDYAVRRDAEAVNDTPERDGALVVKVDADQVATFVRFHGGEPLGPGEHLLRYRRRRFGLRLGAESFFFQEGLRDQYAGAKYGELRVTSSGDAVLVGLRDAQRLPLGPGKR